MAKVNFFLTERLKRTTERFTNKISDLAERSSSGALSSFSGVFRVQKLTHLEKEKLRDILDSFATDQSLNLDSDLEALSCLTSELRAISNQAAILHGERIKKAQSLLKNYKEGAFTAWMIATYGNRQTPYNFLQYYEFYNNIPELLQQQLDAMPRQVVYALASREGDKSLKEEIIKNFSGQTKDELMMLIRRTFPLSQRDKRAQNPFKQTVVALERIRLSLAEQRARPTAQEKEAVIKELKAFLAFIEARKES